MYCPTLTGVGERAHLLSPSVDAQTHVQDLLGLLEAEELQDVILVGHSYAGIVISGVAAHARQRLRKLVYLDALLVEDGQSWADAFPPAVADARRKSLTTTNGVRTIPPPDPVIYGFADAADTEWVRRRLTPHPYAAFEQKMHWGGPLGGGLPRLYIDCALPAIDILAPMKDRFRARGDWPFIVMKTGHDAMVSAPEDMARLLQEFA